jgi:hypothetical protein
LIVAAPVSWQADEANPYREGDEMFTIIAQPD